MTPKKSAYLKTFGLFLLYSSCGACAISLINRYLRTNGMASQLSTYVLWLCLTVYFFFICRWLFRKLNIIENLSN